MLNWAELEGPGFGPRVKASCTNDHTDPVARNRTRKATSLNQPGWNKSASDGAKEGLFHEEGETKYYA